MGYASCFPCCKHKILLIGQHFYILVHLVWFLLPAYVLCGNLGTLITFELGYPNFLVFMCLTRTAWAGPWIPRTSLSWEKARKLKRGRKSSVFKDSASVVVLHLATLVGYPSKELPGRRAHSSVWQHAVKMWVSTTCLSWLHFVWIWRFQEGCTVDRITLLWLMCCFLSSAAIDFPWGDVIDNNVFDSVSWDIFHSWLGEVPQNIDSGWEMMHRRILTGGIITEMLYQAGCCQGMS